MEDKVGKIYVSEGVEGIPLPPLSYGITVVVIQCDGGGGTIFDA
jgi:hypothetical protein